MKGQSSIEYMILFGLALLIIGTLWVYTTRNVSYTRLELEISQAKNALDKISNAVKIVSIQGPPAQTYVYPTFPKNIQNITLNQTKIELILKQKGTLRRMSRHFVTNISGNVRAIPGNRKILVKAKNKEVLIDG